jgi:hypothetical protein
MHEIGIPLAPVETVPSEIAIAEAATQVEAQYRKRTERQTEADAPTPQ